MLTHYLNVTLFIIKLKTLDHQHSKAGYINSIKLHYAIV